MEHSYFLQGYLIVGIHHKCAGRLIGEQGEWHVGIHINLAQEGADAKFVDVDFLIIHTHTAAGLRYFKPASLFTADLVHIHRHHRCPIVEVAQHHIGVGQLYIIRVEPCRGSIIAKRINGMALCQAQGIHLHGPHRRVAGINNRVGR